MAPQGCLSPHHESAISSGIFCAFCAFLWLTHPSSPDRLELPEPSRERLVVVVLFVAWAVVEARAGAEIFLRRFMTRDDRRDACVRCEKSRDVRHLFGDRARVHRSRRAGFYFAEVFAEHLA